LSGVLKITLGDIPFLETWITGLFKRLFSFYIFYNTTLSTKPKIIPMSPPAMGHMELLDMYVKIFKSFHFLWNDFFPLHDFLIPAW
jgi:hypothetical protein